MSPEQMVWWLACARISRLAMTIRAPDVDKASYLVDNIGSVWKKSGLPVALGVDEIRHTVAGSG